MTDNTPQSEVIGLIPAAGRAARISPLPCSKELFPIGFRSVEEVEGPRPKVVSHYLLEKMRFASILKAYVLLRSGKWDIPAYFGDGSLVNMNLAYIPLAASSSVCFTLDQAYPFVRHATVAFGFPDILFDCQDGFVRLLSRHSMSGADVTLGLFPANHPSKEDTVDFDDRGEIQDLILRPSESALHYTWGIAAWSPGFTEFLHDYMSVRKGGTTDPELSAGHAMKAALGAGLRLEALIIDEKPYLDIGTAEDLVQAVELFYRRGTEGMFE
jgi:glucose-1-phosphate thymidylyltransferase